MTAGAAGGSPRSTLLYIADNLADLTLLETILWDQPVWRIVPAMQARLGLELAKQHAPRVVLLDVELLDMHVAAVLRALRAGAATAEIPVIVISSDATFSGVEALFAAGAHSVLLKPIDVGAFMNLLRTLLTCSGEETVAAL